MYERKGLKMITIQCTNDEWPIYEAYSIGRGWLFRLLGGGWRKTYVGKNGENIYVYRIWARDRKKLLLLWFVEESGLGE